VFAVKTVNNMRALTQLSAFYGASGENDTDKFHHDTADFNFSGVTPAVSFSLKHNYIYRLNDTSDVISQTA